MGHLDRKTVYLARAAEARRGAARSFDAKIRQGYIAIAQQWENMAQAIDERKRKAATLFEPLATRLSIPA